MDGKGDESARTPKRISKRKNKKKLVSAELLAPDESLKNIIESIESDVMRLDKLKKQSNSPNSTFQDHFSQGDNMTIREFDEERDGDDYDCGGRFIRGQNEESVMVENEYVNMTEEDDDDTQNESTFNDNAMSALFRRRRDSDHQQQQQNQGGFSPVYESQIPTLPAIARRNQRATTSANFNTNDPNVSIMRGMVRDGNKSLRL